MSPPKDAELFETSISTHWMEGKIMCAISKQVERTIESYKEVFKVYEKVIGGSSDKLCLLSTAEDKLIMVQETRAYLVQETPRYIKAMAIISHLPFTDDKLRAFMNFSF